MSCLVFHTIVQDPFSSKVLFTTVSYDLAQEYGDLFYSLGCRLHVVRIRHIILFYIFFAFL